MRTVFGRYGALMALGMLAAACGGGDEAAKPAQPPPPPPVASVDTTPAPTATTAPTPPKPTLAELEATTVKTILDGMNAHDAAKVASAYTDDGVVTMAPAPACTGKAAIQKEMQGLFDQYKDMKFWYSRSWTKGDMAAYEWGWSGTDTGGFMGGKPTEKPAGTMGLSIYWFSPDGLIKKEDSYLDIGTVMTQLGQAKGKAKPVPTAAANVEAHVAKGSPDEDKNVDWAKSLYAAMDAKKEADFLATMDDNADFMDYAAPQPGPMKGKADAKKFFGMWTKAFPDAKNTVTNAFGVEDFVIVEMNTTGTQKGALGPLPASKKPVNLHTVDIYQVANGKMVHGWSYSNSAELLSQIGVLKAPGAPSDKAAGDKGAKPADKGAAKGGDAKGTTPAKKP